MAIVYGFDVGTGSLAAVIRKDTEIVWKKTYILDPEFASTAGSTTRRRMARTRLAHRAREYWWNECCEKIGLPTLKSIKKTEKGDFRVTHVDDRLKREFPAKDDVTIYASCLLRVHILTKGLAELEPWQIYKAIHAAIQKRGYDPELPWANRAKSASKNVSAKKKDEDEASRLQEYEQHLRNIGLGTDHQSPCFFEARQMGLWTPEKGIVGPRQNHLAAPAETAIRKGFTPPRKIVETELRALLEAAKSRYPDIDVEFVMYGPHKKSYASYGRSDLKPGRVTDWQGVLGQKVPRFDNRALRKCLLIPRFNVCKQDNSIFREFHIGWQIHNLRVYDKGHGIERPLSISEFKQVFDKFREKGSATAKQLESALGKLKLEFTGDSYALEAPRGGRSSFSRPALRILNEMLQNGYAPYQMHELMLARPRANGSEITVSQNTQPAKGLTQSDLDWLKSLGDAEWSQFWLPQARFDAKYQMTDNEAAIKATIAEVNNPVVRHRLSLFGRTLDEMTSYIHNKYGAAKPEYVAVELVRDDFLGEKAKKELNLAIKKRRDANADANKMAKEMGVQGGDAMRKVKLWQRQGEKCLYTGRPISQMQINACEIDHIVPRANGGPDAEYNLVLTFPDVNRDKGNRTPWQWFGDDSTRWGKFLDHIKGTPTLRGKVVKILTSAKAGELVDRYQNLAETAWMSKLLTTIIQLKFGWKPAHLGHERRVHHISGGLTSMMRHKYDLNSILDPHQGNDSEKSEAKKNREDDRHHLLDAMVISFIPAWARNPMLREKMALPEGVTKATFANHIAAHRPIKIPSRPVIEENFYGLVVRGGNKLMCKRESIQGLGIRQVNMKPVFSIDALRRNISSLEESLIDPQVLNILKDALAKVEAAGDQAEEWKKISTSLRHPNGSIIRRLNYYSAIAEEINILPGQALTGKQLIKPKGNHRGFYIVRDSHKNGSSYQAMAIFAWESLQQGRERISSPDRSVLWFTKSGDYVETTVNIPGVPAGIYQISTITNGKNFKLRPINSTALINKSINPLITDGNMRLLPASAECI